MIVALTGATGLIGNALGQKLVKEGHRVRALVRRLDPAATHYPCDQFVWDFHKPAPREAFVGADAVVHLAGENVAKERWTPQRKQALRESRILTCQSLAQGLAAAGNKPKIFISASAVGIYGNGGDDWKDESSQPGQDFLATLCREWEAAASSIPAARTVIARLGVVLSGQGGFLGELAPMFQRFGASRLGSGKAWLGWIHIDDAVAALMLALSEDKLSGPVNLVSPKPETNRQVTEVLKGALATFSGPPAPALALRLLYGELAEMLLGSQRVRPVQLEAIGFQWRYEDFGKAVASVFPDLETGEVQLVFEQWVSPPPAEIWPFFSSEHNLERITPPSLSFRVTGRSGERVQKGTTIDYQLKLHGLPFKWQTLISEWQIDKCFVDEQLRGPYQKWHHTHEFEPLAGGTLLRDTIRLKPPLGLLGRAVSLGMILKEVGGIFSYRAEAIRELFLKPG